MAATAAVALTLTLGLFLIQVITSTIRREPAGLGRAAKGLVVALVMSVFAFSLTKILLDAVDQLSAGVVAYAMGTDLAGLGTRLKIASLETLENPAMRLLFSLVIIAAVVVLWAAMMIRKMLIIIGAVLTPLAFSGATAEITDSWVRRWVEFMAAMIASKLLLVIIFMIGASVRQGAGISAHPGPGQQLTQVATGSLIPLLAGFAPWLAIKMFHFTGDALHTAHAATAAAPSGARAVLGAPQKVNTMHSPATQAANKFSGNGPGTPAGTQPPKESADSLKGTPSPNGHSGGPASHAETTTRLPAATAAKPVSAAAGPAATGTGSSGSSRHQEGCHRISRGSAPSGSSTCEIASRAIASLHGPPTDGLEVYGLPRDEVSTPHDRYRPSSLPPTSSNSAADHLAACCWASPPRGSRASAPPQPCSSPP
jgi:type IV secretion system protein TrbL